MARVPSGRPAKFLRRSRDRAERVEQRLGGEPPRRVARVVLAVGFVLFGRLGTQAVSARLHDRGHDVLEVEAVVRQLLRERVEELRIARRIGHAHVVHGLYQPDAHEVRPECG
jgi:hypothetical protein